MPGFAALVLPRSDRLKPTEARSLNGAFSMLALMLLVTAANAIAGIGGSVVGGAIKTWMSSAVYVLVAGVVALRAIREPTQRRSWVLFALGLSLYGIGNVLWAFWLGRTKSPPIPSICDVLWLSLYPLSYAGIAGLARVGGERHGRARLWLDGIIVGAGTAAVGAALVFQSALDSATGSPLTVATELAYPVGDLALAALIVGVLALRGWRPGSKA